MDIARRTARLWRGLSYDQVIALGQHARRELGLERPTERKRVIERLTREELEQLLQHAYGLWGVRGLMIKTLVLTGARVSEFVGLDVADLRYAEKEIHIRHGKGRKERVVPILPALADELVVCAGHRRAGPMFPNPDGQHYSARRIQQIVQELARGAGIAKRVYPHLMRHTVAQHLLEGGMTLDEIRRFLGHDSITTTQIYAESTTAMIRDSYRKALG